jgi:predicted CopG family antitoxin
MSIFISRPDLLEKLIERKRENIESGIDAFHVNMGIN